MVECRSAFELLIERLANGNSLNLLMEQHVISTAERKVRDQYMCDLETAFGNMMAGLARVDDAVEDLSKVRVLLSVFAHRSKAITRSDHLRYNWILFLDMCYAFKEKVRNFLNEARIAYERLDLGVVNVSKKLKSIDLKLGKYIRERGEIIHEWAVPPSEFLTIGFAEKFGSEFLNEFPEGKNLLLDVKSHFEDARFTIKAIQKKAHHGARGILDELLADHEPNLKRILVMYAERVRDLAALGYDAEFQKRTLPSSLSLSRRL